jgi:hypothetical protein
VVSTSYPDFSGTVPAGQTYTVGYDSMNRPNTLMDSRGFYAVQGVIYNAAYQPVQTEFQYSYGTSFWENRGYNQLNQLTTLNSFNTSPTTVNGTVALTYGYCTNQNNGQIQSSTTGAGSYLTLAAKKSASSDRVAPMSRISLSILLSERAGERGNGILSIQRGQ